MADIFISYASEDRERVIPIVKALEAKGLSVWWDRKIPPGKKFSEVIEEEVSAAGCLIVLWSIASVKSDFVQTEAAEAARKKILVPAIIDEVQIPFEFRRIQAANLLDFKGESCHEGFQELIRALAGLLGPPKLHVQMPESLKTEPKKLISAEAPLDETKQVEPKPSEPKTDKKTPSGKSQATKIGALIALAVAIVAGGILMIKSGPKPKPEIPAPAAVATGTLVALVKLVAGTGQAADALEKFSKAIGTGYDTASHVVDDVSERSDRRELEDINKAIVRLYQGNIAFLDILDGYLKQPTSAKWSHIQMETEHLIATINQLFGKLDRERTGLVHGAPEAYFDIVETLEGRSGMLYKLRDINPPPDTAEEIEQLRLFKGQYARLAVNLKKVSLNLSEYINKRYEKK